MEPVIDGVGARVAEQHRALIDLAAALIPDDVPAVRILGAAVLLHGLLEPACLAPILRLVDPAVRQALEDEHEQLRADLLLLGELQGREDSDALVLASALHERLRHHLDRDERTLYRPLGRLSQLPTTGSDRRQ